MNQLYLCNWNLELLLNLQFELNDRSFDIHAYLDCLLARRNIDSDDSRLRCLKDRLLLRADWALID